MNEARVGGGVVMEKMHSVAYRATLTLCTFPISSSQKIYLPFQYSQKYCDHRLPYLLIYRMRFSP